ncbi:MAG: MBL fold metallo-hydrolase, partial [Allorhizobium sp.]
MKDMLTLLGTKGGPAIRPGGPNPTSMLLALSGRRIVIDCGLGVSRGLVESGMSLKELDLIFITHLHSDHVLELGPLIHTAWTTGLDHPVRVYGPAGTSAVWAGFLASLAYDIETRIADEGRPDLASLVTVIEYGPGEIFREGDLVVEALRVD